MKGSPASTVRLRKIGNVLRRLREESGHTLKTAGRHLERSASSLSSIENGMQWLRLRDLGYILDQYNAAPQLRAAMMTLAEQELRSGWWDAFEDQISPEALDYASVEWDAAEKISTETTFIPGLLQTEDYARAINRTRVPQSPPVQLERFVAFRMARQQILYRDPPTRLRILLDEAALRRVRGGRHIMRAQLQRLLSESEQHHIHLQVLPLAVDPGPAYAGQFELLDIGSPPILSVVLIDHLTRRQSQEREEEIQQYRDKYEGAAKAALSEHNSRDLVHRLLSEL